MGHYKEYTDNGLQLASLRHLYTHELYKTCITRLNTCVLTPKGFSVSHYITLLGLIPYHSSG